MHAPAQVVAEEFSPTSGVVTDSGADGCLLTTGADSLGALTFHLAALGVDFTVLEPKELTDFIAATAERLAQVAQHSHDAARQRRTPGPADG